MPTGSTISRTDAAAKPRCANARAASSSRRGRRLDARFVGRGRGRAARDGRGDGRCACRSLERQTLVWSSGAASARATPRRADNRRHVDAIGRRPASRPRPRARRARARRHPVAARARSPRRGARARRPEGREGRARRAAVPRRPAGHLLVRRHRRPAEDEQRHALRRADHLHRPAAGRLVRRRHGDQARGLSLQHRGAAGRARSPA